MTLNEAELNILKLMSELEVKHQKHTPTEVKQRFRRLNKETQKADLDKSWTILVSSGYIKEWTETLSVATQKARLAVYRSPIRTHLYPIKTDYCKLTGKAILYLDGREVEASSSLAMEVHDVSAPFKSVRAIQTLFESAKKQIRIVDNYIGPRTLDYLMTENDVPIKIITETDKTEKGFATALGAFQQEYKGKIEIKDGSNKFHGRFIIIDEQGYLIDHSIKQFAEKPTALISLVPEASKAYIDLFNKGWKQGS